MTTSKTYRSSISYGLLVPLIIIIVGLLFLAIYRGEVFGIIVISLSMVVIMPIYLQTYYTITNNELKVKCGYFINMTIDVSKIRKIKKTRNPLSAPALSLNRLEVFYGKFDSVLISPKEREDFIKTLTEINPNIALEV